MAKRKRLDPMAAFGTTDTAGPSAPETKSALGRAPIADVARDTAHMAALDEVTGALAQARASGQMIVDLPLSEIVLDHLVRDRTHMDAEEFSALKSSIMARGQQVPVEVVALEAGRYGLISGWRRCQALMALRDETGEGRFAIVRAVLRQPAEAGEAYVAMVEENELRVGLSHYERGRIVARAVDRGVFADDATALGALFAAASRPKRSKIGSFVMIVRALDGALRFPQALGERTGLALARLLHADPQAADRIAQGLARAAPDTPEAEQAALAALLRNAGPEKGSEKAGTETDKAPKVTRIRSGLTVTERPDGAILIEGDRMHSDNRARLIALLRQNF